MKRLMEGLIPYLYLLLLLFVFGVVGEMDYRSRQPLSATVDRNKMIEIYVNK